MRLPRCRSAGGLASGDSPNPSALGARERHGVALRYGLDGGPERTLTEVAGTIGVSRQRVRLLETRALEQLASVPELRALRAA